MALTRHEPIGAAAALLASLAARAGTETAVRKRPNILWLVSEDNNPLLGAYGDEPAHTPNIDALARDGVVFRNDDGFIPEGGEAEGFERSRDRKLYPLKKAMSLASAAARRDPRKLQLFRFRLSDSTEVIRYWACAPRPLPGRGARRYLRARLSEPRLHLVST